MLIGGLDIAVCLGWAGVRPPSKGRLKETVAAPVVPCGGCVLGLAPAHTAAVWLSVWAAGITGRPFTPALTAVCSPSPSTLVHSVLSAIISFPVFYIPCLYPLVAFMPDCYQSICLSVFLSLPLPLIYLFSLQHSLSAFRLTQKHKHKQQQM